MATEVKKAPPAANSKTSEEVVVERAQQFWSKNSKFIVYALAALIILVGGYFAYQLYVKAPEEKKATDASWKAEQYYRLDSFSLALNGHGADQGFLKVISKYGSTKAGNMAKFYAGACYLQLGDFNNAVKYLKDFSTDAKDVKLRAAGLLGDAYSELGKKEEAVKYYREAGSVFEKDNINSPEYLFRAALLLQDMGKNQDAIDLLHKIREKFPNSPRAFEVEKYLARLGETK